MYNQRMEKLTIKAYATKHKLSHFNVIKMVKQGAVKSETEVENGKEVVYILNDETVSEKIVKPSRVKKPEEVMQAEIDALKKEVQWLHHELTQLKEKLR